MHVELLSTNLIYYIYILVIRIKFNIIYCKIAFFSYKGCIPLIYVTHSWTVRLMKLPFRTFRTANSKEVQTHVDTFKACGETSKWKLNHANSYIYWNVDDESSEFQIFHVALQLVYNQDPLSTNPYTLHHIVASLRSFWCAILFMDGTWSTWFVSGFMGKDYSTKTPSWPPNLSPPRICSGSFSLVRNPFVVHYAVVELVIAIYRKYSHFIHRAH